MDEILYSLNYGIKQRRDIKVIKREIRITLQFPISNLKRNTFS